MQMMTYSLVGEPLANIICMGIGVPLFSYSHWKQRLFQDFAILWNQRLDGPITGKRVLRHTIL